METLTKDEKIRYARHIMLDEVGEEGQTKLKKAKVLIVGVGGLGSPLALYLAAAGVGEIGLIDGDTVSASNLQRQVLYSTADIGKMKVDIAAQKLQALNPYIRIHKHQCMLTPDNADTIIKDYDIVADGCDNLTARYIINDACVRHDKVYVYGAIAEFTAQLSVFNYKGSATYRCLYPYDANTVNSFTQSKGVLGVLPGIIGNMEANEVIKVITGCGEVLADKLLLADIAHNTYTCINITRINP